MKICNCMYGANDKEENQKGIFHKLYSEMMLARELCQYGHVDNWALSKIVEQRVYCGLNLEKEQV